MYVDTPRDHVDSVYDQLLFGDQPLGWDIIGTKETIRAADRQTFLDYLDAWYAPPRMVVGAAGAVDDDFAAEVERQFGHLADRATGAAPPTRVVQDGPRVKLETRDSDQAHLRLGVRGIRTTHPDRYAMQVLTAILGGGMSSRLFTEVRERLGLAYYVFGHHQSYDDAGTLFSQAGVDINRIDLAVQTIVREFRKIVARAGRSASSCGGRRTTSRGAWCSSSRIRAACSPSVCAARCSRTGWPSRRRCSRASRP